MFSDFSILLYHTHWPDGCIYIIVIIALYNILTNCHLWPFLGCCNDVCGEYLFWLQKALCQKWEDTKPNKKSRCGIISCVHAFEVSRNYEIILVQRRILGSLYSTYRVLTPYSRVLNN